LDLAHSQVGCHQGIRKIKRRIVLNFAWPTNVKDVIDYCKCCDVCQMRARITFRDRVPIEGGVVSTEPIFSHFYVDCLGPLFNTKVQHIYALVFLDKTSRFPHAVPLSSVTKLHLRRLRPRITVTYLPTATGLHKWPQHWAAANQRSTSGSAADASAIKSPRRPQRFSSPLR